MEISVKFVVRGPINNIPSHYQNRLWLVYWCIYALLGLNELRPLATLRIQVPLGNDKWNKKFAALKRFLAQSSVIRWLYLPGTFIIVRFKTHFCMTMILVTTSWWNICSKATIQTGKCGINIRRIMSEEACRYVRWDVCYKSWSLWRSLGTDSCIS